jgi:hypothetical protein
MIGGELFSLVLAKSGICIFSGFNEQTGVKSSNSDDEEPANPSILLPGFAMIPSIADGGIKEVTIDGEKTLVLKGARMQISAKKVANIYANGSTIYVKLKNASGVIKTAKDQEARDETAIIPTADQSLRALEGNDEKVEHLHVSLVHVEPMPISPNIPPSA